MHVFLREGGALDETTGRACLCNALTANVELGQTRLDGYVEEPLLTLGADVEGARELALAHPAGLSVLDALRWLLAAPLPTAYPIVR